MRSTTMGKLVAGTVAVAALTVPSAALADPNPLADTGKPENPGCFGDFASDGAQTGLAGEFVRTVAEMYRGNDGDSIGEDGVPFLKFISCPGDYRGRNAPEDQP